MNARSDRLATVGALHRARMESERARAPSPPTAPAAAPVVVAPPPPPSTEEALMQRRTNLLAKVAALRAELPGASKATKTRVGEALNQTCAALSVVNMELRKFRDDAGVNDVPRRLIAALLEIVDRYQDAGAPLTDAEVAELDAAAGWLESTGGGDR